jgi:spore coat protein U-like protein
MNVTFHRNNMLAASIAAVLLVGATVSAESRAAGSANADITVSASVADNCTITSTPVVFGTFDTLTGDPLNGAGTVTVACTNGASAAVSLDEGQNKAGGSSASSPLRQMLFNNGADHFLSYNLYTTSARNIVWGSTGVAATADGTAHDIDVFGKVDGSQQSAIKGDYSDTVNALVSF